MGTGLRDGVHLAETEAEKQAVYRFRYDVYVEEMGRYQSVADHPHRLFFGPEDDHSHIVFSVEEGKVIATARLTWGHDGPFSPRQMRHYSPPPSWCNGLAASGRLRLPPAPSPSRRPSRYDDHTTSHQASGPNPGGRSVQMSDCGTSLF